jgi:hypothetical protein
MKTRRLGGRDFIAIRSTSDLQNIIIMNDFSVHDNGSMR